MTDTLLTVEVRAGELCTRSLTLSCHSGRRCERFAVGAMEVTVAKRKTRIAWCGKHAKTVVAA